MAEDEDTLLVALRNIAHTTETVSRAVRQFERPEHRTPENIQQCVDALYRLGKALEKLKIPMLMEETLKECANHRSRAVILTDQEGMNRVYHWPAFEFCGTWDGVDGNLFHIHR